MKLAIGLLVVIVLFLLAGVLPVPGGDAGIIFKTPVFMLLVATECVLLLVAAVRQVCAMRLAWALAHGGVVVLLLGALLGYLFGKDAEFSAPVGSAQGITQIPATATGVVYTLPFSVRVSDFRVDYYDPCYNLFRPAQGMPPHEYVRTVVPPATGMLVLAEAGAIPVDALHDARGAWQDRFVLDNGWFLRLRRTPKHFEATLQLQVGSAAPVAAPLAVNHPVTFHGWKFYLMSYDDDDGLAVHLSVRRDPGRRLVIGGIWMVIIGSALLCWVHTGTRASSPVQEEN